MAKYDIRFRQKFIDSINKLDKPVKEIADKKVRKIIENPFLSKPLRGEAFLFSERFLQYRIIFKIENEKLIFMHVGKRDEVYG